MNAKPALDVSHLPAYAFGPHGLIMNAYGSAVWTPLGFHTFHLVTDVLDTAGLTLLMFTRRIDTRRFVDVSENAVYWYFVVGLWVPVYAVIYWAARLL